MNLEQLPYKPGDVVRERKSNMDYVIESIGGAAMGAGAASIAIVGIGLFNDKVKTWKANSPADMSDQHALIFKGTGNLTPAMVRQQFREIAEELLTHEQEVLDELFKDSNLGLRDLLMYGISARLDDDTKAINTSILNLAEALTTMTRAVPDEKTILQILRDQRPTGISDEALELFARNLSMYAKSRNDSSTFFASKSVMQDLLLKEDGSLGGDLFTLLRGFNRRYTQDNESGLLFAGNKKILNSLLLGDGAADPGRAVDKFLFNQVIDSPRDRIRMMAEKMFLSRNGRAELPETTRRFLDREGLIDTVVKVLRGGNNAVSNKDPNKAGADLLIDALANWLIDPENTVTRRHIARVATGIALQHSSAFQAEKLAKIRKERYLSFTQRAKADYSVLARDQYSRATGVRRANRPVSFKLMTPVEIENAVAQAKDTKFAISKDALFTSVLGNTRLKINGVEGTIKDQAIRTELENIVDSPDPYYILTANQIRSLQKQVASTDLGDPIDLLPLVEHQKVLKEQLTEEDRNTLSRIMLNVSNRQGDVSLVGLGEKSKVKLLYQYNLAGLAGQSDGGKVGFTTDISHIEELNAQGKLLSVDAINVAASPKARGLYTRVQNLETKYGVGTVHSGQGPNKAIASILAISQNLGREDNVSIGKFGNKDRIGELISIVKSKNNLDKLRLLDINKASQADIQKAYQEGYRIGRLALARVEKPGSSNIGQLTAIASEIRTDLSTQLSRAEDYFAGKGIILDIESYNDIRTGLSQITQVAFGDENRVAYSVGKKAFTSPEKQAETIINLTNKLEEQFKAGKTVVGTAGPHDFNTLIQKTSNLITDLQANPQLHPNSKDEIIAKLTRALEILKDTQENRLFDTQPLYSLTQYRGIARQSYFTQHLLTEDGGPLKIQTHQAARDVKDLNKILMKLRPQIMANLKAAKLSNTEDYLKQGLFMVSNDSLNPHGPGPIKRMLGTVEYLDQTTGKMRAFLQYDLYESVKQDDGTFALKSMNVVGQDEYHSLSQMALTLNRHHHLFTAEQFNEVLEDSSLGESIAQQHARQKAESAGRRVRAYNPSTITRWDPLGEWENSFGDYAAFRMHMDKRITAMFPTIQKKYNYELERIAGGGEITTLHKLEAMNRMESWIDNILTRQFKATPDMVPLAKDYFKIGIHDVLEGKGGLSLSDIVDDGTEIAGTGLKRPISEWNRFLNSAGGEKLLEAARLAIGLGDPKFGQAPDPTLFSVRSYFYTAAAANKAMENMKTATKVSDFVTETGPRLSLGLGDKHATSILMDSSKNFEAKQLVERMGDVAAKVMLSENKENAQLQKALQTAGIDFETFLHLMEDAKKTVGGTEQNLEKWKEFIQGLGFQGESQEYATLKNIRKNLIADNLQQSVVESLNEKVTSLTKFMEKETDTEAIAGYQNKITFAQSMLKEIEEIQVPTTTAKGASVDKSAMADNVAAAISTIFQKYQDQDETLFQGALSDRYFAPANIADLTREEIARIEKTIFGHHGQNVDDHGILNYLRRAIINDMDGVTEQEIMADVAHHVQNVSRKSYATYEYAVAGKARLSMIARLHKQGNSLAQILSNSLDSSRQSTFAQHRAIVEAWENAAKQTAATGGSTTTAQHNLITQAGGVISSASKTYSKVSVPLLALGGLVGLMAVKAPNTGDTFHQGYTSDNLGSSFTGNENAVAKFSEIPGNPDNQQVWYGSTSPFQLDITFHGFVGDRMQQDRLRREVYNILNSNMEIRKSSGEIQDNRNKQHRMAAVEALRGQI